MLAVLFQYHVDARSMPSQFKVVVTARIVYKVNLNFGLAKIS